ncbi:non-homologous end-joining DNA ligase [Saccharothrix sp.]|uniref:non-homologous end-joining DNA ligase n=1 Tax=Saccharothrix sp. TaxID=1873460 RepID=UPI0028116578|nr:non-homologous end-joining DNA ligase [Saccharothrix sp.]
MAQQHFPDLIRPMLAVLGDLPEGPEWAFEFKWDGVRATTYVRDDRLRVLTRNDLDASRTYPELHALTELLNHRPAVLDGEIVALDPSRRPNFSRLQSRIHTRRPTDDLLRRIPVAYYIFDVLHLDGRPLLTEPYTTRRRLLDDLHLTHPSIQVPPCFTDLPGTTVQSIAATHGLEGVVAKRKTSRYDPGRRSPSWIKVPLIRTQEVVIGGWRPGEGRRSGTIGALLLGVPTSTGLHYAGKVGTGFTAPMLEDLQSRLAPLSRPTSPFTTEVPTDHARAAHWVHPTLVGEVQFRTWTPEGRLRHPSWRGLRPDKSPSDLTT